VLSRTGGRDPGVTTEIVVAHCLATVAELVRFYDQRFGTGDVVADQAHIRTYRVGSGELVLTASERPGPPPETLLSLAVQERP
jgi:hypothetical protein